MILEIQDLNFSYKDKLILSDVNLKIEKTSIVGLVGDNGSGKSTLMKLIVKLLNPKSGEIKSSADSIGAFIENPQLYSRMKVRQNIDFFAAVYGADEAKINEISSLTGIDDFLNKKVNELSLGMKQRVGLAISLISSDTLILLDEPTNGLDPSGKKKFLEMIRSLSREKGITFIISSHNLYDLEEVCDIFYKIVDSKVFNVHDDESRYGYRIKTSKGNIEELTGLLKKEKCDFKVLDEDVLIKKSSITEDLNDYFIANEIELTKREIGDIYFE